VAKHPILSGIAVLVVILVISFLAFLALGYWGDELPSPFTGERIAVVEIRGTIYESRDIIGEILKHKKNDQVKAIILRIDSQGGMVAPSQEVYEEVKKATKEKKVVASMQSVAASGGYYIACAADKIVANPGTLIGSIGVILQVDNFEDLMKKIGLKRVVIKSGRYKDLGSSIRSMTEEEREILQSFSDNVHEQFIKAVVEGRNLPEEEIREISDGRVFTGEQAQALGLVDKLGNLQDAIDLAATMVGIEGEPKVIYPSTKRRRFLDFFIEEAAQAIVRQIQDGIQAHYRYDSWTEGSFGWSPHIREALHYLAFSSRY
jgi:protease-4